MDKNNIIFIGFMGTGKTTIARIYAEKHSFAFIDIDAEIEKQENDIIKNIFFEKGREYFRNLETEFLHKIFEQKIDTLSSQSMTQRVISTGGGIVLRQENMDVLQKNGVLICLTASPEIIYERIKEDKNRPLLDVANPKEKIEQILKNRKKIYEKADIMIDTSGLSKEEVLEKIEKKYYEKSYT